METQSRSVGLLITFAIKENLRFLSHAETLRLWQRAIIRSGISLVHTKGFNPRPKISLPLPRSVGVQTDCDLVYAEITENADIEGMRPSLERQIPDGCRVIGFETVEKRKPPQPQKVEYRFEVDEQTAKQICRRGEDVISSEKLTVERTVPKGKIRLIDVRPFIENIMINENKVTVLCNVSNEGSIRIEEMLGLLNAQMERLLSPVTRTKIVWN